MIPEGRSEPDFEIFIFPEFFGHLCREFFAKLPKNGRKWSNFFEKVKISKSGSDRPSGIIRTHHKTKMGVIGTTSAENFSAPVNFQAIFWPFSPIDSQKYAKRCYVRGVITRPPVNIFQFCKKFLNPHIPNFKTC